MNKCFSTTRAPAFILMLACTLMATPLSVLSQSTASTTSSTTEAVTGNGVAVQSEAVAVRTAPPVLRDNYRREPLVGDQFYNDFVVGPGKFELEVAPGDTEVVELTVSNRMPVPQTFKIDTEDTTANDEGNSVLLGDEIGPYTLRDYISVPYEEFELAPNTRTRIPITVSLPNDAEPGGRYGSLIVSVTTRPNDRNDEGVAAPGSAIINRIGTLFFVTTPGELNRSGQVLDFGTRNDKKLFSSGPIPLSVTFENTGTVHVTPYGTFQVANILGDVVGEVELSPWFVLPQSIRTRDIQWNRDFLLGRYTATLTLNRGYDDQIDTLSYSFWVIPWQLVASVMGGLFLFFLLIRLFFSRFELKKK